MFHNFQIFPINEFSVTITIGNEISLETFENVLFLKKQIKSESWDWLSEVVGSYTSISVFVSIDFYVENNSLTSFFESYCKYLRVDNGNFSHSSKITEIPVHYNGIDLDFISKFTNLSVEKIIEIHSQPVYMVALIGFLPGFPYLIGLDERLKVPRKENPRKNVEKGSVAIGGIQTGIYPMDSPGGWQIIGKTDVSLFSLEHLALLKIGDKVKFNPIF